MKIISELIPDIYSLVQRKDDWFTDVLAVEFSSGLGKRLQSQLSAAKRAPTLRLSAMGPRCPRALWYSIHHPELAEPLPPWAEIKYSYGHMIEALAIMLAKAAGHEVTGEQDALQLDGIVGHRDCVIDGCVVDVKSCSSRSFQKFKNKAYDQIDEFGYLDQLDGYVVASHDDPLVKVKDKGYILAIDKTVGRMLLYEHPIRERSIRNRISDYKIIVASDQPPQCCCGTEKAGASGNIRLDTRASYSAYKFCCFPTLRAFAYAEGPTYLTKVVRTPDVPEIFRKHTVPQVREVPMELHI